MFKLKTLLPNETRINLNIKDSNGNFVPQILCAKETGELTLPEGYDENTIVTRNVETKSIGDFLRKLECVKEV